VQKIAIFTYRSSHFCFPWRRLCDYHTICCMDEKTIQCLPNPSQHVLSSIVSELLLKSSLKSMRKSKNRYFYHIFVFPGDAPGAITLNVVAYGWKENLMLTNCLASCAHLTITVSEIERDICENIILSYPLAFDAP